MRFVNRQDELRSLQTWWDAPDQRAAVVWGRRRVGKTALLQRFAADLPAIFHTGAGRPAVGELVQLSRQVSSAGVAQLRDLGRRPYVDWDDALDGLAGLAADAPFLVVLDEFPELVATSPELPGVLRAFLDRAKGRTQLRLLLCGSAVRHMEALQEERSPLYGRFELSLVVHPFRPHEAAQMLPDLTPPERAVAYGLLGGVPLYLSWWDQAATVEQNVHRLACQPGARLLTEGQLVLATEVERGEYPAAALHAVAAGRTRYGELKQALRAEPARTLERLVQLRLLERVAPVTASEAVRWRRGFYRIADNYLAFYLGVLSRFRAEIERGLGETILPVLMTALDDHLGAPWEDAFRQHLRRLALHGQLGEDVVAIGPWWSEGGQSEIDAVVLAGRRRDPVLAGEAKWARRQDAARLVNGLQRKAVRLQARGDLRYAVCARERLDDLPPDALAVTADDIFSTA